MSTAVDESPTGAALSHEHEQIDINGQLIDKGLAVLMQLIWARGIQTSDCCEGGGTTPETALAYVIFPSVADAAEFLLHCSHLNNYRFGDRIALTIQHPDGDAGSPPRGKVTWMPELTVALVKNWES